MEWLDIVDRNGMPTGNIVSREKAHAEGILHRTSHVWLIRCRDKKVQVLLQQRCETKDSWPGCYDVSSAGHISAGEDYIPSALRELREELGIAATPEDLIFCGDRYIVADGFFNGRPFHDRQYSRVFAIHCELEESGFHLQEEEIASVWWVGLEECIEGVKNNTFKNCLFLEELEMLKNAVADLNVFGLQKR